MSGSEIDKSENYGYDEEAPLAPPVSEVKDTDEESEEPGFKAPYVKNNDKASDYKSTGFFVLWERIRCFCFNLNKVA